MLQFAEGLSGRQAADAVQSRTDWKYVLGLELTDAGFDFSVVSEFRDRLLHGTAALLPLTHGTAALLPLTHGTAALLPLTALLEHGQAAGALKARGCQRTDSTRVLTAIHALNRLENVGETLRHALDVLATVALGWLRGVAPADWFVRYGRRLDEYRLPKEEDARQALAAQIGADGRQLLTALCPNGPRVVAQCWRLRRYTTFGRSSSIPGTMTTTSCRLAPGGATRRTIRVPD